MAWTERYVTTTGAGLHDGTSEANAWTLAEAIAAPYAAGQRINVKAGTYANTTTDRTFGVAGSTTSPIWWRGYNSAIGDLDADFTTAKPAITFTTGGFLVTGAHQWFSNLNISGARTAGPQVNNSGGSIRLDRVRVECTGANAASSAIRSITNADVIWSRCWFKATATATSVCDAGVRTVLAGSTVQGGGHGILCSAAVAYTIFANVFDDNGGDAIRNTAGSGIQIINNSIYGAGSDGVEFATTIAANSIIAGNIIEGSAAWAINNSTGANTALVFRSNNAFYNNTSGNETGFGDTPSFSEVTESASPFTNAASQDFSLLSTALSKAAGLPGLFENQTYTSYLDIGAVQRQEGSSGGSRGLIFGG